MELIFRPLDEESAALTTYLLHPEGAMSSRCASSSTVLSVSAISAVRYATAHEAASGGLTDSILVKVPGPVLS